MMHATLIISILALLGDIQNPPQFESQVIDDNVSIGYGLAIGDVDGDRKPDILLADKKQFVWYRNGDWKRFVMVDNLTESDNVCIAARDIDGDGKVEVAVGAQWNPGETSDTLRSGSVHYLIRPKDPTQIWTAVKLHHEPVIHRMRWVKTSRNGYQLVVLPLHGRGNKGGEGAGVKVFAYEMPADPRKPWRLRLVDDSMHLTHNLDVVSDGNRELVYIGGKEGVKAFTFTGDKWTTPGTGAWLIRDQSFGEVRAGQMNFVAGIQPMHGNELVVASRQIKGKNWKYWWHAGLSTAFVWTARYYVVSCIIAAFLHLSANEHLLIFARNFVWKVVLLVAVTPGGAGIVEGTFKVFFQDFITPSLLVMILLFYRIVTYYLYLVLGSVFLPRWIARVFSAKKETMREEVPIH